MATSTITTNPYTFNIVEDMIITPNIAEDVPTGSVTYKRTYRSTWNVNFTVPAHITVVQCHFTWHYGGDERPRLNSGIKYGPGSGCGIQNARSTARWQRFKNAHTYIGVVPGRTYNLTVWVDGYKGRDYGFVLSWSPGLNGYSIHYQDNDYAS